MTTAVTVMMPSSFALLIDPAGGTTFVAVKDVKSFDLGNISADEIDTTSFSSTGDFRDFAQGLKQASDGSFVIHYLIEDTQHKALRDAVGSNSAVKFKATATAVNGDDEIVIFSALIKSMSRPVEIGGLWEATVGFKMTGSPAYSTTP